MVNIGSSPASRVHPAVARASTVPALLDALQTSGPGPRLTWYASGGERIELSGRVLANWVAKTANLLREEFDVEPGTGVRVDLPGHWRRVVVELALGALGAHAVADLEDAELVVTGRPEPGPPALAVAPDALARGFAGPLHGAVDYAAEVAGYDDVLIPEAPAPLPAVPPLPAGARLLLTADGPDLLGRCLAVWRADGSVVLADADVSPDDLRAEGARTWQELTG